MTKRIQWLDTLRGVAILFVIVAHCSQLNENSSFMGYISYFSFLFIMPVFFTISGFLFKDIKTSHDYYILMYKKIVSFMIPFLVFNSVFFVHHCLVNKEINIKRFFVGFHTVDTPLWFLLALLSMFLIVGLLSLLRINLYIQITFWVILLLLSRSFWAYSINSYTQSYPGSFYSLFYQIYSSFIFFYLGIIIRKYYRNFQYSFLHGFKWYLTILILLLIIQFHITTFSYQTDFITVSDLFTKVFSVLVLFSIFSRLPHGRVFKYFNKYGKVSFIIYMAPPVYQYLLGHRIVGITLLSSYYSHQFIIMLPILWFLSIFTYYLAKKSNIINFIFYPRKYVDKLIMKTSIGRRFLNS